MRNPYRRHLATLAVVVLLLAVLAAAGCGGRSETTSTTSPAAPAAVKVTTVAVITPEKANDYGWNQQGVESARRRRPPSVPRSSSRTARATATSRRS